MANLQIKNVPPRLHRFLRVQAKQQGRTLRDLVLEALRREVQREEFRDRLRVRSPVHLLRPAARTLEEVRSGRDVDLTR